MLESVKANIRYLNPEWRERTELPRIWSRETRRANTSFHAVDVESARPLASRGELELDKHGFALVQHGSRVRDFRDDAEVAQRAANIGRDVEELRAGALGGSPAQVVDKLARFAEVGATRVYLQMLDLEDLDHLELVGSEVIPQLSG